MCEHEGRKCPGRTCRCECMNCMFPREVDLAQHNTVTTDEQAEADALLVGYRCGLTLEEIL